jgi:hypothetical protein
MFHQQQINCYNTTYAVVKILLYGDLKINKYSYSYSYYNIWSVLCTGCPTFFDQLTVDSVAALWNYNMWSVLCTGCPTFLGWLTVDSVGALWNYNMWSVLCPIPSWTGLQLTLCLHSETIICKVYCALDALPSWTGLQLILWLHFETIICEVYCALDMDALPYWTSLQLILWLYFAITYPSTAIKYDVSDLFRRLSYM